MGSGELGDDERDELGEHLLEKRGWTRRRREKEKKRRGG
jgi:hypothetical protein